MWNLKENNTSETHKSDTDSQTEKTNLWLLKGKDGERNKLGVWD